MTLQINNVYVMDCVDLMADIPEEIVDLTVTSPPYDNLRTYKGYTFDFEGIAKGLLKVTKVGGIVVWVVGKKIVNGNMMLTPFRQALFFQSIGFNVHDVMIFRKKNTPFMRSNAYTNSYEFMFVLAKGRPKTFNPIKVPTARSGMEMLPFNRRADGSFGKALGQLKTHKVKENVWEYAVGLGGSASDKIAFKHPAIFPEKLAEDHILSWSNPRDLVFDPMCGSGTTLKMAKLNDRNYLGCDISDEYVKIAKERLRVNKEVAERKPRGLPSGK